MAVRPAALVAVLLLGIRVASAARIAEEGEVEQETSCGCLQAGTCSDCGLQGCIPETVGVKTVKALGGGLTSALTTSSGQRIAAWRLELLNGMELVLKLKSVDKDTVVASQVAHMLDVATPRLVLADKMDCNIAQAVQSADGDADKLIDVLNKHFDQVDGILLQDFFNWDDMGTQLPVHNAAPTYQMLGRIAVLDFLEGKPDLFNDIPDRYWNGDDDGGEVDTNVGNVLFSISKEVAAVDLGQFGGKADELAVTALNDLIKLWPALHSDSGPFNRRRIPFVEKQVGVLLCRKLHRQRMFHGKCGIGFPISDFEAMQVQIGMVEAWKTLVQKQDSIKEAMGRLPDPSRGYRTLDAMVRAAGHADLNRAFEDYSRMTEKDFVRMETRCCEVVCFRYDHRFIGGFNEDVKHNCHSKDNKMRHIFEMTMPEDEWQCNHYQEGLGNDPTGWNHAMYQGLCDKQCEHVEGPTGVASVHISTASSYGCSSVRGDNVERIQW